MDIKRVEGTALNEAILNAQPIELSQEAENLAIAIRTSVSQALMGALSDELSRQGFIEATVEDVSPNRIKLMLNNGVELNVDSQLSLDVKKNDVLRLMISSLNPLVLKIMDLKSQSSSIPSLKQALDNLANTPILKDLSKQSVENSGLFYEKKLIDFILKAKDLSSIASDNKYQILQDMLSLAKGIKSSLDFQSLPFEIKQAIDNIANGKITNQEIQTLIKPSPQEPPKDLTDILNMLVNTQESPKDISPFIPRTLDIINNIEKNYIFDPKKIPDFVLELSSALKEFPQNIKDNFLKSLQNIINTSNIQAKELLRSNIELFLGILNIDLTTKTLENIKDALSTLPKEFITPLLNMINNPNLNSKPIADFVLNFSSIMKYLPQDVKDNIMKNIQDPLAKEILNLSNIISNTKDEALKNVIVNVLKNIDSIKQDFVKSISQNPVKIFELSKHMKNQITNIQNNLSFDKKLDNIKSNANILNNINMAQNFIIQNNMFFVNFEEESSKKGFGAFKKEENEYKAFIKLNWEDGFLGSILSMPKNDNKKISIKFFTDIEPLSKVIESKKSDLEKLLKEENLSLSAFEVNLLNQQEFDISVLKTINESGNLNIFT